MITVIGKTVVPYKFDNKNTCFEFIRQKCQGLERCVTLLDELKDKVLEIQMPITAEIMSIHGDKYEIDFIKNLMTRYNLWR